MLDGQNNISGCLYVVATPIGHLDDISIRAKKTLEKVNWIACEDTRHSVRLLNHLGIHKTLYPLHEHNEVSQAQRLITLLAQGEQGALISDAGTPVICDPGFRLINLAYANQIKVSPIPGACALISALSALAIGGGAFYFEGFLVSKTLAKIERLKVLADKRETLVFYEAPHRIKATLALMQTIFGPDRLVGVARELTKRFESLYRCTLGEMCALNFAEKGEFVIVVAGHVAPEAVGSEQEKILTILLNALPLKQAVQLTAQITGSAKNQLYELALKQKLN